jgi:tetratricopeptide (TPR) repeat protein
MRDGDIVGGWIEGQYCPSKVLRITACADGSSTAHVLSYESFPHRPDLSEVVRARIVSWHAPIDLAALERDTQILGHVPVERTELVGYLHYLKLTDFNGYLKETGHSAQDVIHIAQEAYELGNRLSEEKRFDEAIAAYERAIDAFPLFYEAHDNRAMALMDLGRDREAAKGFEESLRVQPDNPVACFSRGECFLKLGEHDSAIAVFRECVRRWPDRPHHHEFLKRALTAVERSRSAPTPRWQFW